MFWWIGAKLVSAIKQSEREAMANPLADNSIGWNSIADALGVSSWDEYLVLYLAASTRIQLLPHFISDLVDRIEELIGIKVRYPNNDMHATLGSLVLDTTLCVLNIVIQPRCEHCFHS